MGLSLGYNTFKLRSFTPQELNLPVLPGESYTIERHQRYFHLCYIPCFGIGQFWAIRKSDDKLYEMAPDFIRHLDARGMSFNAPWYTFSGPIIAGLILLGTVISTNITNSNKREEAEKEFAANLHKLTARFNNPSTADYYAFCNQFPAEHTASRIVFRVAAITRDSLQLMAPNMNPIEEHFYYDPEDCIDFFSDSITGPSYWVSRKDLEKAICKSYDSIGHFTGIALPRFPGSKIRLTEIDRVQGAIWDLRSRDYREGKVELRYVNKGLDMTIEKIIPLEGPREWDLATPVKWPRKQDLTLSAFSLENKYKCELLCSDSLGNKFTYQVVGAGMMSDVLLKE